MLLFVTTAVLLVFGGTSAQAESYYCSLAAFSNSIRQERQRGRDFSVEMADLARTLGTPEWQQQRFVPLHHLKFLEEIVNFGRETSNSVRRMSDAGPLTKQMGIPEPTLRLIAMTMNGKQILLSTLLQREPIWLDGMNQIAPESRAVRWAEGAESGKPLAPNESIDISQAPVLSDQSGIGPWLKGKTVTIDWSYGFGVGGSVFKKFSVTGKFVDAVSGVFGRGTFVLEVKGREVIVEPRSEYGSANFAIRSERAVEAADVAFDQKNPKARKGSEVFPAVAKGTKVFPNSVIKTNLDRPVELLIATPFGTSLVSAVRIQYSFFEGLGMKVLVKTVSGETFLVSPEKVVKVALPLGST